MVRGAVLLGVPSILVCLTWLLRIELEASEVTRKLAEQVMTNTPATGARSTFELTYKRHGVDVHVHVDAGPLISSDGELVPSSVIIAKTALNMGRTFNREIDKDIAARGPLADDSASPASAPSDAGK